MTRYLLDTNICVHFLRQSYDVPSRIMAAGWDNCCISEITAAELLYGAERSNDVIKNRQMVESFCKDIEVLSIRSVLKLYAKNKAILYNKGMAIEDFDLLIGSTAVFHNLIMVTENVKHLQRIPHIVIENWVDRN